MRRKAAVLGTVSVFVFAAVAGAIVAKGGKSAVHAQGVEILVYFTRHAEDQIALFRPGASERAYLEDCKPFLDDGEISECCLEVLNPVGELRATLLARWFRDQGITDQLTHAIASHKIRTRQTIAEIAFDAGLGGDIDQNPGDGVQQIPPFVEECADGFEGASSSRPPMVAAIAALPAGSVAVVGAHSGTLYPVMEAFGIDTSDPADFPRRANGKVDGFNNLWVVSIDSEGFGQLVEHVVLNLELVERTGE